MNLDEINQKDELLYLKKIINLFNMNLDETLNKKIDNLNIKKSKKKSFKKSKKSKKSIKKSKKNIKKSLDTSIFFKSDLDNFLLLLNLIGSKCFINSHQVKTKFIFLIIFDRMKLSS